MTLGAPGSEHYRFRAGLAFLAVGIALLLFAWVSWVFRTSAREAEPSEGVELRSSILISAQPPVVPDDAKRSAFVRAAPMVLLVTFLVVLAFLVGSVVLVRGARRHLESASRKPRPPTPSSDVWAMHRLPDDADEDAA